MDYIPLDPLNPEPYLNLVPANKQRETAVKFLFFSFIAIVVIGAYYNMQEEKENHSGQK